MAKIDKIDINIINLLMDNGRFSSREIARQIGHVSERAIRYRIDKLINKGFIQVCAIPNPRSYGFNIIADVWLEVDSDSIMSVAKIMTGFECVSYVACSLGNTDLSVQVVGHDTDEIYRFVTDVIGKVSGVRKTTISIVPIVLKDIYQWRIPTATCLESET